MGRRTSARQAARQQQPTPAAAAAAAAEHPLPVSMPSFGDPFGDVSLGLWRALGLLIGGSEAWASRRAPSALQVLSLRNASFPPRSLRAGAAGADLHLPGDSDAHRGSGARQALRGFVAAGLAAAEAAGGGSASAHTAGPA